MQGQPFTIWANMTDINSIEWYITSLITDQTQLQRQAEQTSESYTYQRVHFVDHVIHCYKIPNPTAINISLEARWAAYAAKAYYPGAPNSPACLSSPARPSYHLKMSLLALNKSLWSCMHYIFAAKERFFQVKKGLTQPFHLAQKLPEFETHAIQQRY